MGAISTLLYIAPLDTAESLALGDHPQRELPGIWLKHLGDGELTALWQAVDPAAALGTLAAEVLCQAEQTGLSVIRTPKAFVAALGALADPDLRLVATQWGASEGLADWDLEELTGVLTQLRNLARQALADGQPVLLVAGL